MNQTSESVENTNPTKILKKKKTRKQSKVNNGDIGPILDTLGDDVTTVSETENVDTRRNSLATGARKIPVMDNHDDGEYNLTKSNFAPNIYLESRNGFRAKTIKDYEKSINNKRFEESIIRSKSIDKQQLIHLHNNPGLYFVVKIHEILQILSFTLFGILAGASLGHTLFVQSLINPRKPEDNDTQYYLLVKYYGIYAQPISITFYTVLTIIGVFVFGKFDLGRPTVNCVRRCIKLQNGLIAIIFYIFCFAINNSMNWFDYILYTTSNKEDNEIIYLLNTQSDVNNSLKIWLILDASRTAFILITWISIATGSSVYDRLTKTLSINPMAEGRNEADTQNQP
ncbi:unnamed protein product [Heterobilharzia americana]|nr:unnamed protein product [Heterobilharzia americana]